jgi:hypothetical protein
VKEINRKRNEFGFYDLLLVNWSYCILEKFDKKCFEDFLERL